MQSELSIRSFKGRTGNKMCENVEFRTFLLNWSSTDHDFQFFKAIIQWNLSIYCFLSCAFKTNTSNCYLKVENNIFPWLTLKSIQVKRSYLASFWKITMFFFSISNENYSLHINEWGTIQNTTGHVLRCKKTRIV